MLEQVTIDKHFIGGEWVAAGSDAGIDSVDPANGTVWATVPAATADDVDRAVAAAKAAFVDPAWALMSQTARGELLYRIADAVTANAERLATLEARDSGMTLKDARGAMGAVATWFRYYAGMADKITGQTIPANPAWHAYTTREPLGVVGAILPWNQPLLLLSWKVAPALATGNTIVVKPAEQTPVTALEFAKLLNEAGVPPGVVNVIVGAADVGEALVRHPDVAKISFTGEHRTAQKIAEAAAGTLKRVSCECGGKAPHIVFADANLDKALPIVANSAFRYTGQSCALGSRVFLHADIHDEVLERLSAAADAVHVGDPFDERSDIGPQAHADQLAKTLGYIDIGRDEGAQLVRGGGRPEGLDENGFYVEPTILAGVRNDMRIAQEEIFGPVASVIRFEDEADLIAQANDVVYGLTAGVWTRNVSRAHRLTRALRAGSVWVNVYPAVHYMLPYGGVKLSGYGRENGEAVIHEYTSLKSVVIDLD